MHAPIRSILVSGTNIKWLTMKLKDEKELVKKAIALGVAYGEKRGAVEFEATDSASDKLEYIYRLLVHDKLIQPLPEDQVSQKTIRHKLAIWASRLDEPGE